MSLENLEINPKYIAKLKSVHLHKINKLLLHSCLELQKKTGLPVSPVEEILSVAARYVVSKEVQYSTAIDIFERKRGGNAFQTDKLKTGCKEIDEVLGGGLLCPGVTEVAGESSSGKTQFCLQACIVTSILNPGHKCLYICTEDVFPNRRLQQLAFFHCKSKKIDPIEITNKIFIEHAADLDTLISFLETRINKLLRTHTLKMIVIDSVAAIFRVEFEAHEMAARAKMLSVVGKLLHKISYQHKVSVLCVNQVSAVFDSHNKLYKNHAPALGLTWSYFVGTRLMLSRTEMMLSKVHPDQNIDKDQDSNIRSLAVVFSPYCGIRSCYYLVLKDGIKGYTHLP